MYFLDADAIRLGVHYLAERISAGTWMPGSEWDTQVHAEYEDKQALAYKRVFRKGEQ